MKYGILGDIHSNLSALEAVLEQFHTRGVDKIISVGDVVGYGAAPRECIRLLQAVEAEVVLGNHDAACTGALDSSAFNPYAKAAVEWTCAVLDQDEIAWLRDLPLTKDLEHCSVAHGALAAPERFDYIQCTADGDPSLDIMERPVCFVGHTHVPVSLLRLKDDASRTAYTFDSKIDLTETSRALINAGSVGQPRDEDPRSVFVIYDADQQTVVIDRTEYDIDREARRIRDANLPPMLADRLFLGV